MHLGENRPGKRGGAAFLSGLLAVTVLTTAAAATEFPDVDESAPCWEAVDYVSQMGVMIGKEGGNFDPEGNVTRAEMAAILCRVLYETEGLSPDDKVFPDVPDDHWASGYIVRAAELGIINGYDDGNFGPGDNVTYEQAVTMVVRTFGGENEAKEAGGYPDGYLTAAKENGLLDNIYATIGEAFSRGQVAVIIYNAVG